MPRQLTSYRHSNWRSQGGYQSFHFNSSIWLWLWTVNFIIQWWDIIKNIDCTTKSLQKPFSIKIPRCHKMTSQNLVIKRQSLLWWKETLHGNSHCNISDVRLISRMKIYIIQRDNQMQGQHAALCILHSEKYECNKCQPMLPWNKANLLAKDVCNSINYGLRSLLMHTTACINIEELWCYES